MPQEADKHTMVHHLSKNIKALRKVNRWSQCELAEQLGMNRGNIASYENGSSEPRICNLIKMSHVFGVSIMDLTLKDLSCEQARSHATANFTNLSQDYFERLRKFEERYKELDGLTQSLHTCYQHKLPDIQAAGKEARHLSYQFEQLYEASQQMIAESKELLLYMRCGCDE